MVAKKKNNPALKAAIGTFIIVFLSIAVFLIADTMFRFREFGSREEFRNLMENQMLLSTFISFAMLVLSVYLIFIYLKDYLELKKSFTLGILLAVVSFMLFAMSSNPILHWFLGIYGKNGLFMLIPPLFATISLAILAWISSK